MIDEMTFACFYAFAKNQFAASLCSVYHTLHGRCFVVVGNQKVDDIFVVAGVPVVH